MRLQFFHRYACETVGAPPPGRLPVYLVPSSAPGWFLKWLFQIIQRTCFWYFSSGDTTGSVGLGCGFADAGEGTRVGCSGGGWGVFVFALGCLMSGEN